MTMIPKTVGDLRYLLQTYSDDIEIYIQGDTESDPNAVPIRFAVEFYGVPDSDPPMLLLAGLPYSYQVKLDNLKAVNDPSASWNLPK